MNDPYKAMDSTILSTFGKPVTIIYPDESTEGADIFQTWFAPADFVETVNTIGLPRYAKQKIMDFEKGGIIHTQSNPLPINLRPRAVIKLTMS